MPSGERRLLLAALLLAVVVMTIAVAVVALGVGASRTLSRAVAAEYRAQGALQELLGLMLDAETGGRGYLITGDTLYLQPYLRALADRDARLADVRAAMTALTSSVARAGLAPVESLVTARFDEVALIVALRRDQGAAAAQQRSATGRGRRIMVALRAELDRLEQGRRAELDRLSAAASASYRRTLGAIVGLGLLLIAGLTLAAWQLLRRRAEHERVLRERKNFFELAQDLLCIADFEGRFVEVSPSWERQLGYRRADLEGHPFLDFVHPDDRDRTAREASLISEGSTSAHFRNRYRTPDASYHWLDWTSTPDVASGLIYASARDVTAQVRVEAERDAALGDLAAQRAALEETNGELEAFTYSVSHDLRAPIRHVSGFAELLSRELGPGASAGALRHLRTIRESAARMGSLVDDLLQLSRLGRTAMTAVRVSLTHLVAEARRDAEREAAGREIRWHIGPLPDVVGDAALLRVVFVNLLGNAVKYTGPRAVAEISVEGSVREARATVRVRDNGMGFDMKYRDKLFGVFQRLHGDHEFTGTGIGLATVQRIVARHGGTVTAEGAVDAGACFIVVLPAAAPDGTEARA